MEKFLGKFKPIADKTENLDGYFTAMKMPDEVREAMRKSMAHLVCGLMQEGADSYRECNDYGEHKEEFVFKLGVPVTTSALGLDTENTFTLNGDCLDGVHEVGGQKTTTKRFYQGDVLVFESEGNGATMRTYFTKIAD